MRRGASAPRVGILATGDRWHVRALGAALRAAGCDPAPFDGRRLAASAGGDGITSRIRTDGIVLEDLDALLVRFIPAGSLDQIVFRMDLLHVLAGRGVPVVNHPRAVERTVDKHWTSRLLADAGIPTPRTVVAEQAGDAMRAFREFGDVVIKPLLGSGGRGICRVGDEDVAYRVFRALEAQRSVFYVQEFVPHGTSDLRLLVIGDRVVAAARRRADGWKTNVAAGGTMTAHKLRPHEEDLALRASTSVGADLAGVDLIEADDGRLLVGEVNGIPGWIALQRTTSLDLAAEVAAVVTSRLGLRRPRAAAAPQFRAAAPPAR